MTELGNETRPVNFDEVDELVFALEIARNLLPVDIGMDISKMVYLIVQTDFMEKAIAGLIKKAEDVGFRCYDVLIGFLAGFMTATATRIEGTKIWEEFLSSLRGTIQQRCSHV